MSRKPDLHPDLFAWADSRPSATIIDAEEKFAYRRMSYEAQIALELFVPPPVTGRLVILAERRDTKIKRIAARKAKRAHKGRAA